MLSWYWIVSLAFALLMVLILITKTNIEVLFQRHGEEDDYLSIKVTILKYISIKKEFPIIDIVNKGNYLGLQFKTEEILSEDEDNRKISLHFIRRAIRKIKLLIANLHNFLYQLRKLFRGFLIVKFHWTTKVGIDDAAILATAVGGIWIVKSTILQHLFYLFPLESKPNINVNPEYQQNQFKTQLHCIFQFKVGYAIYAGIKLIYLYKKGVRHV